MENRILISIIIPVYKVEQYLSKCLDSILAQTFSDFEALLIDDGSPDRSGVIAEEYAARDSRIKVFHKENGGVSSARNYGIKKAQGVYIAFCDSDDWVDADWLETLYRQICEYPVDLSVCGLTKEDETGKTLFVVNEHHVYAKNKEEALLTLFDGDGYYRYQGWVVNKLYKKDILIKNQIYFNDKISYSEDRLFNFFYLRHCKSVIYSTASKYHYLIRQNSAMTSYHENAVYDEKYGSFMDAFEIMWNEKFVDSLAVEQALASNYILDSIHLYLKYRKSAMGIALYGQVKDIIKKHIKILPVRQKYEYTLFLIHPLFYERFLYYRWQLSKLKNRILHT